MRLRFKDTLMDTVARFKLNEKHFHRFDVYITQSMRQALRNPRFPIMPAVGAKNVPAKASRLVLSSVQGGSIFSVRNGCMNFFGV